MSKRDTLAPPLPAKVLDKAAPDHPTHGRGNLIERITLELRVDEHRCMSCGGCVSVCPRMDIPVSVMNSIAEGVLCRGCGICVRACPVEALSQVPVSAPLPRRPTPDRRRVPIIRAYPGSDPA